MRTEIAKTLPPSTDYVGFTDNHAWDFHWKAKETLTDHSPHFHLSHHDRK